MRNFDESSSVDYEADVNFLYNYSMLHVLEWPSLTVESLKYQPIENTEFKDFAGDSDESVATLLLGTHVSEDQNNYIILMDVLVPNTAAQSQLYKQDLDDDHQNSQETKKFFTKMKVLHAAGEPNRLRAMPQNQSIIASISIDGAVRLFDLTNAEVDEKQEVDMDSISVYSLVCHEREGWGLSWSKLKDGHFATAANDQLVCIWDCNNLQSKVVKPLLTLTGHSEVVEDVIWHPSHENLLISVGDDGRTIIWDTRQPVPGYIVHTTKNEGKELNAVSVNNFRPYIFASGGEEKAVNLYDIRNPGNLLYKMVSHKDPISRLEFSPNSEYYLGSSASDKFIYIWSLANIGKEQNPEDAKDGPPELIFNHTGQSGVTNDFCWIKNSEDPAFASITTENQLHLWCPSNVIFTDDFSDDEHCGSLE